MSVTTLTESPGEDPRRQDVNGGAYSRAQLARLFRLVLILQTERFPNARELAERCEVSRRTVYRDLELLTDAGIPVRYRPERQGYQLSKGFFLPPTSLEETEALALLILARQWRWGDGLGLLRHAWGGAVKLVQGLPPEIRERVLASAEPFQSEPPDESQSADRRELHEAILASLTQLRQVRLWYTSSAEAIEECTKFSLYRLLLHDRRWFMVGRSTLHRRVEVIGVPWVKKVVLTDDRYAVPPRFNLERFLGQAWGIDRSPMRYRVWLRFSVKIAPELNDTQWHKTQRRISLADGRVDLHFVLDGIEEVTRWVLGFGNEVEVIEPETLRKRVFEVSAGMARQHRPKRPNDRPTAFGGR